ncbi:1-aminocyclopropane-1-carboxylate oxidase-like protein 11 [Forsythia ovata]|uniref:1-aminocyclopropane-1-carboxylate oxidase-like protein 11 n=1 Tax=Forsythia ovata TaxID=205694 RepID=A0ABD1UZ44_9LAMI
MSLKQLNCQKFAECRSPTIEYINQLTKLGELLFELLAEALGLKQEHLVAMECAKRIQFYLPLLSSMPQLKLTLGTSKHTDCAFLTIVPQDQIGGLQVLKNNQWIDV